MESTLDLLTIALLPGAGPRRIHELATRAALADVFRRPSEHADLLGAEARAALHSGEARRRAEAELGAARASGLEIVGWDAAEYPDLLRRIYDPPAVLYVRGRLEREEGGRSVSVVGSRRASGNGSTLARALGRDLARAGLTVVSGLARGIDTAAHRGALDGGGRSVAVLGSGLDRMYPPENVTLADALVARGGAVVSEFPLGTAPAPGHFPRRNRIIAGWSQATVVVEAAERSGALVTARCALDEGREVMAVPGHPSHAGALGTNQLIRDGAALVRDARDILLEMGFAVPAAPAASGDDVLEALPRDAPCSVDELQARSGRTIPELLVRLSALEMEAKVRRVAGGLFVRQA